MLILLVIFLILASILILFAKRNRESFYLAGMCLSLAIMLTAISIYIAKKGGISRELNTFFFLNYEVKTKIQYMFILLDQLGYLMAIGRYLFPMFLMLLAIRYSMIPVIRGNSRFMPLILILPLGSLILYYPRLFRLLTEGNDLLLKHIADSTNIWITLYVGIALLLLVYETASISTKFFRRQFISICVFMISMSILYLLYCGQEPAQVYNFYSDSFIWKHGIYYMHTVLPIPAYLIILLINLICAITGITSLYRYTSDRLTANREEIIRERKLKAISPVTSVFVHSIKNQLLANRVVYKRLDQMYQEEKPDIEKIHEYIGTLSDNNEVMLSRMEELYKTVKYNTVHLVPVTVEELVQGALELFNKKYPEISPEVDTLRNVTVLADKSYLCEALYNLLTNAQEAIQEAGREETGKIILKCYNIRLYTVMEVIDNGIGMNRKLSRKVFEPFYTSKNSNYNWGMGLHYVQAIVKEHYGSLRYESKEGKGSHFYLMLPRFRGV